MYIATTPSVKKILVQEKAPQSYHGSQDNMFPLDKHTIGDILTLKPLQVLMKMLGLNTWPFTK